MDGFAQNEQIDEHDEDDTNASGNARERNELERIHGDGDETSGETREQGWQYTPQEKFPATNNPEHGEGDAGTDDRHETGEDGSNCIDGLPDETGENHDRHTEESIGAEGVVAQGGEGDGNERGIAEGEHDGRQDGDRGGTKGGEESAKTDIDNHDLDDLVGGSDGLDQGDDTSQSAGLNHDKDLEQGGAHHEGDGEGGDHPGEAGLESNGERGIEVKHHGKECHKPTDETSEVSGKPAPDKEDEDDENGEEGEENRVGSSWQWSLMDEASVSEGRADDNGSEHESPVTEGKKIEANFFRVSRIEKILN